MTNEQIMAQAWAMHDAAYGGIVAETVEWRRFAAMLDKMAKDREVPCYFWTPARGVKCGLTGTYSKEIKHPNQMLERAIELARTHKEKGSFVVLLETEEYMNSRDPNLYSHIREAITEAQNNRQTIWFIQPDGTLPKALADDLITFSIPLPDPKYRQLILGKLLSEIVPDLARCVNLTAGLTNTQIVKAASQARNAWQANNDIGQAGIEAIILGMKEQCIKDTGALSYFDASKLDPVAGYDVLQETLAKMRAAFHNPDTATFNVKQPKGVLLVGIPGTGKTLYARTCGRIFNLPVLEFAYSGIFGSLVGETEKNLKRILKIVDAQGACILVIDEFEKMVGGSQGGGDSGTSARAVGSLLTWLSDQESAFVVATCNDIERLPQEIIRQGRFDDNFFLAQPTSAERLDIWKALLGKYEPTWDGDWSGLVEFSMDYTGAEIGGAIKKAKLAAFRRYCETKTYKLTFTDLVTAIRGIVPLAKSSSRVMAVYKERLEAGEIIDASKHD